MAQKWQPERRLPRPSYNHILAVVVTTWTEYLYRVVSILYNNLWKLGGGGHMPPPTSRFLCLCNRISVKGLHLLASTWQQWSCRYSNHWTSVKGSHQSNMILQLYITAKTSWLLYPQSGYPGYRQTGETVVVRGSLLVLKTYCIRGSCPVHLTTWKTTLRAWKFLCLLVVCVGGYCWVCSACWCAWRVCYVVGGCNVVPSLVSQTLLQRGKEGLANIVHPHTRG